MNSMFETDIQKQRLLFGGRFYDSEEVLCGVLDEKCITGPLADLNSFLKDWFSASPTIEVQTSGSTGKPKIMPADKKRMIRSAIATCRFFDLKEKDTALLCMNLKYIGAKMMVVRALVAGMELIVNEKIDGRPFRDLQRDIDFAAIVPLQLYNSIHEDPEALARVRTIIVGGGAVDQQLRNDIQGLDNAVYSTYGMTETLSHIALRKLNGPDQDEYYTPLPGVSLSLTDDGRLTIHAPEIVPEQLVTNDIAHLSAEGKFLIRGRADNVIVSGGVKVQIEEVEMKLSEVLDTNFALTSVPDSKFGEKIVLLVESGDEDELDLNAIKDLCETELHKYQRPKAYLPVFRIPLTENGKINRLACKELASKDKNLIFVR